MGRIYFDEITQGASYTSARRTVTEADVVNFAGISGDFNPLHMDEVFGAEETPFGTRIAHGLLIVSMASGLRSELDDWHVLAFLECNRRFVGAVLAGETIHAEYRVATKRQSESKPDRGVITVEVRVLSSDGRTVQEGKDVVLVAMREGDQT